jgi:thiosulfate/3-mercaptopyruvate sulfurtransferase
MNMKRLVSWLATLFFLGAVNAGAVQLPGPLVDTDWLAKHGSSEGVVILDVRDDPANFAKQPPQGKAEPKQPIMGHIPGARLLDFKLVRETREVDGVKLDKMVLTREKFEALMGSLGVKNGDAVVVVTNNTSTAVTTMGTRVYWTLKYFGHDNLALLDGGTSKWIAEGRPLAHDQPAPAKTQYTARAERQELLATTREVESVSKGSTAQLLDGRTADFFVGQSITGDVKAKGHIPGSRMFAHTDLVNDKDRTFKSRDELARIAKELGVDPSKPSVAYCNTGHLGSGPWFVMSELLGAKNAKLYDGSMHEWTKDASRPVSKRWENPDVASGVPEPACKAC